MALRRARKRKPKDKRARAKRATHDILAAKPHCIKRGAARILGHGMGSCDTPSINNQMKDKHPAPKSDESWPEHEPSNDDSDNITFVRLPQLMDRLDPYVGVGPRGFHANYVSCLNRARSSGLVSDEGAGVQPFRGLGQTIFSNASPPSVCRRLRL